MRVIKFRQKLKPEYVKHSGEFHFWGYVGQGFTSPVGANHSDSPSEQFTGLQDINGVDIYEGDILETPYEVTFNDFSNNDGDEGIYRGKVHYRPSKGFMQTKCLKFSDCEPVIKGVKRPDLEHITQSKCKVIGNIHQNPELLEDK